jgi:hypothetical protein
LFLDILVQLMPSTERVVLSTLLLEDTMLSILEIFSYKPHLLVLNTASTSGAISEIILGVTKCLGIGGTIYQKAAALLQELFSASVLCLWAMPQPDDEESLVDTEQQYREINARVQLEIATLLLHGPASVSFTTRLHTPNSLSELALACSTSAGCGNGSQSAYADSSTSDSASPLVFPSASPTYLSSQSMPLLSSVTLSSLSSSSSSSLSSLAGGSNALSPPSSASSTPSIMSSTMNSFSERASKRNALDLSDCIPVLPAASLLLLLHNILHHSKYTDPPDNDVDNNNNNDNDGEADNDNNDTSSSPSSASSSLPSSPLSSTSPPTTVQYDQAYNRLAKLPFNLLLALVLHLGSSDERTHTAASACLSLLLADGHVASTKCFVCSGVPEPLLHHGHSVLPPWIMQQIQKLSLAISSRSDDELAMVDTLVVADRSLVLLPPIDWSRLSSLTFVDLHDNQLEMLPASFGAMPLLEGVLFEGNPMSMVCVCVYVCVCVCHTGCMLCAINAPG